MKQVIVNADDFGVSPGVNAGIIAAHRTGIVTSTTVMVNMPYAAEGIAQIKREAPNLGVGLHLNLTAGKPISPPEQVASLVKDNGEFYYIEEWPEHLAQFEADHLQREVAAQITSFLELAGQPPDHFDSHHHATYMLPASYQAMLEHAFGYGIPMREDPLTMGSERAMAGFRSMFPDLVNAFGDNMFVDLEDAAANSPAPFCPAQLTTSFFGDHATLGNLLVILTTLPEDRPLEIMCHPGYMDDILAASQGYAAKRPEEVEHLTHRATNECVQSEGIQLITFADIPRN